MVSGTVDTQTSISALNKDMQSAYKERNKSHNLSLATNSIFAISYWMTL